jgi:hypothetical protein
MKRLTPPVKCLGYAIRPAGAGASLLLSVLAFTSLGCGGGASNPVTGKVTYKNQPVAGTIVFVGSDGKENPQPLNPADGSYSFNAPATGEYKIAVKGFSTPIAPGVGPVGAPPKLTGQAGNLPTSSGVAPPAKYASVDNGLKLNVTGGAQTFDIELQP